MVEQLDLSSFKVHPCKQPLHPHNHKRCIYYHSEKDRRRDPRKITYASDLCRQKDEEGTCVAGEGCRYAHNKVEQAYHPTKYRYKFCSTYPGEVTRCNYGAFCSYSHSEPELKAEILHNYPQDLDFFLFHYKTSFCPYTKSHDRSRCVYAHNWQDFRRNPQIHSYLPQLCTLWNHNSKLHDYSSGCPRDVHCNYSHGRKQ